MTSDFLLSIDDFIPPSFEVPADFAKFEESLSEQGSVEMEASSVYKGRPTCSKISVEDRFTRNLWENT